MNAPEAGVSVGPYELVEEIGEGASGRVFLAEHSILERPFAIKFLRNNNAQHEQFRERFMREARLASQLSHDHLVDVVGAHDSDCGLYLVMEYVESTTLGEAVDAGRLKGMQAVRCTLHVLRGLHHAHEHGLLHRDVKAGNVLLARDGQCKLTDFGLVRQEEHDSRLTADNAAVGTPFYMSPEQWSNKGVDRRTDIFAAGVLLYFLATGHFPFPGDSPISVLERLKRKPHDPLDSLDLPELDDPSNHRQLTDRLNGLLDRALARSREERYATAEAFADDLADWLERAEELAGAPDDSTAGPRTSIDWSDSVRLSRPTGRSTPSAADSTPQPSPPQPSTPDPTSRTMTSPNDSSLELASQPVEIAENVYWVGKRPPGEIFYANPYLRHFPDNDQEGNKGDFNLLVDPGSSKDFGIVQGKVSRIVGSIKNVSAVFINHQDPDVGSATGQMLGRYNPDAHVLCTEDTWRLIHYYNIPSEQFIAMGDYVPKGAKLPTGNRIIPVPSPFCHFVGAMMLYDPESRVLFTGDLFGGLTDREADGLYADESDWTGIRAFHQIYMPTNKALTTAIANIRRLDPAPEIIAPQHGRVIRGKWVEEFMGRLEELPVGLDIHDERFATDDELQAWSTVLNRVIDTAKAAIDEPIDEILQKDPQLRGMVTLEGTGVQVTSLGKSSVERAVRLLCAHVPDGMREALKYEAVFAAGELDLPTPSIELDEEGGGDSGKSPKKNPEEAVLKPDF